MIWDWLSGFCAGIVVLIIWYLYKEKVKVGFVGAAALVISTLLAVIFFLL
jgi:hypothetical protein